MIDRLDLLLEQVREPEPFDEMFVQAVMDEVRVTEQRRTRMRALRRPTVTLIAAAALITGGAVAAFVGTDPAGRDRAATTAPKASATVTVTDAPAAVPAVASSGVAEKPPALDVSELGPEGYTTKHTSYITDPKTGLRLETETYTNRFQLGREHRVTLTLSNTGRHPISISSAKGCGLQVLASQKGEPSTRVSSSESNNDLAWVCAGSTSDPRVTVTDERYVLAPGERRTADSYVRLAREGEWALIGVCRCTYTQVRPTPMPKDDDVLSDLARRALPAPLLPEQSDGSNLATPAIRVYVE